MATIITNGNSVFGTSSRDLEIRASNGLRFTVWYQFLIGVGAPVTNLCQMLSYCRYHRGSMIKVEQDRRIQ